MHPLRQRLFICGYDERPQYQSRGITHLVTIANPNAPTYQAPWFSGPHLELRFGDVTSEAEAQRWRTTAPHASDVERAVTFFREAWLQGDAKLLVSCDYGAARSPALAYLFAAETLGPGREAEAFELITKIRPAAIPNALVVRLGDTVLKRDGALLAPMKDFYVKVQTALFAKPG